MSDLFEDTTVYKALSLWEPWASLMAAGVKRHETRHWSTPYRGPIAIHAAKTLDLAGAPEDLCRAVLGNYWHQSRPLGSIVAVGRLTGCIPVESLRRNLTRADVEAGNFSAGRFAWSIDDVRPLNAPIPLLGRQGLFNWIAPADLEARLRPAVDHEAQCRLAGWL